MRREWKFYVLLLVVFTLGCTHQKEASESSIAEITELALGEGENISLTAQKALGSQLIKSITEHGPMYAVQFCNTAAYPILDTLKTSFHVDIKRASLRLRNPKDEPSKEEHKILENYEAQLANGEFLSPVVEFLEQDQILYAQPIILDKPLCLNCHGQVGSHVSRQTHDLIQELYPGDNAINHQMGDLRGIWSITFDKQELIDYLNKVSDESEYNSVSVTSDEPLSSVEVSDLLVTNCYACHNPNSASHDDILAPPLACIKRRYLRLTKDRAEFIARMASFVSNPTEDAAIMKGPSRRFGLMPKTPLNDKDVRNIVAYIHDNDIPKPSWFDEHEGGGQRKRQRRHGQ